MKICKLGIYGILALFLVFSAAALTIESPEQKTYTTTDISRHINFMENEVIGWDYIVGSGSGGSIAKTINFGVTFDFIPIVIVTPMGYTSTSAEPTDPGDLNTRTGNGASVNDVTTTQAEITHWLGNGDSSSVNAWYGTHWTAVGRYT